ncbi:glycosyltransferase family 2 protein [Candidatus Daviesbacteria bacterium]|nr:glycosyltransferase family 2 protein [Candidatus Daviesbacteria bacterium]
MKKIAIVILNYKLKDLTLNCINSVLKSSYKNLQTIVVDNNSEDNLEVAISKINDVIFIQSGSNLGFTGGYNLGIKKALDLNSDYIFILNPDTTIQKNTIEELFKKAEKYDVAIVSPKIYFSDSRTIWYAGGKFDKANVLGSHIGVDQKDFGQFDQDSETDFATGAAMLVKKDVFDGIGLFDERYFMYYEDSDFCFRAKKAGFKIMYVYSGVVYHLNAQSTGLGSPIQDYYITRNRMLFASKFLNLRTQFALVREAFKNSSNRVRRKALTDFLLSKFGKGTI